jgi:hypothetical protein
MVIVLQTSPSYTVMLTGWQSHSSITSVHLQHVCVSIIALRKCPANDGPPLSYLPMTKSKKQVLSKQKDLSHTLTPGIQQCSMVDDATMILSSSQTGRTLETWGFTSQDMPRRAKACRLIQPPLWQKHTRTTNLPQHTQTCATPMLRSSFAVASL